MYHADVSTVDLWTMFGVVHDTLRARTFPLVTQEGRSFLDKVTDHMSSAQPDLPKGVLAALLS
jgi:hypothetical protein